MSTKRGRAYTLCANSVKRIAIRRGEIQHITEIKEEFVDLSSENEMLQEQNRIAEYCEELADSLTNVKSERSQAEVKFEKQRNVNTELQKSQERLLQYVDEVQELHGMTNKGKIISEVGGRHQYRKLKELKTKVERSLWFARTFGLSLSSVEVKDDAGVYHMLNYTAGKEKGSRSYKDLSEEEQDLVK